MTPTDPTVLLVLALIGTFLLRAFGVIGAGRIEQEMAVFRWIGCVAFAIAAGLMAKILFIPSGILAEASLMSRLGGVALGLLAFFVFGRRLFIGLSAGLVTFLLIEQVSLYFG